MLGLFLDLVGPHCRACETGQKRRFWLGLDPAHVPRETFDMAYLPANLSMVLSYISLPHLHICRRHVSGWPRNSQVSDVGYWVRNN